MRSNRLLKVAQANQELEIALRYLAQKHGPRGTSLFPRKPNETEELLYQSLVGAQGDENTRFKNMADIIRSQEDRNFNSLLFEDNELEDDIISHLMLSSRGLPTAAGANRT